MKIIHASISENGNSGNDGKSKHGDQTGKEVCVADWYSKPWTYLLRFENQIIMDSVIETAKKIANSNLVGYDQSKRNSLYAELKKHGFDVDNYLLSGVKTSCDCSSFVYSCLCCTFENIRSDSNAPTTSEMRKFYSRYKFTVYDNSDYVNNVNNLRNGDILLKPNSHTVFVYDNKIMTIPKVSNDVNNALEILALDVIKGNWGKGLERKEKLYKAIQDKVNSHYK